MPSYLASLFTELYIKCIRAINHLTVFPNFKSLKNVTDFLRTHNTLICTVFSSDKSPKQAARVQLSYRTASNVISKLSVYRGHRIHNTNLICSKSGSPYSLERKSYCHSASFAKKGSSAWLNPERTQFNCLGSLLSHLAMSKGFHNFQKQRRTTN